MARQKFNRRVNGGLIYVFSIAGQIFPCHCEGVRSVRSTLETLAYDCGNPVQYVCGRMPAVLFYLLDRHALLAMTRGSKCVFLNSLTTPALRATPPQRGTYSATERTKFPSIGGVSAGRGGHCFPTPRRSDDRHPPAPKWGGGHSGVVAGILFHCTRLGIFICPGGICI